MRFHSTIGQARLLLVLATMTAILFSCSGTPDDPDDVIDRMIGAYGGPEKIEALKSFTGKGFFKDMYAQSVVRFWPYDYYQRGINVKTKVALLEKGIAYNIRFTTFDGSNYRVADKKHDILYKLPLELELLEYRFPLVFDWLRSTELESELTDNGDESGVCRIEYPDSVFYIEIGVDREKWLLQYVRFQIRDDTTKAYTESYSDYWEVDGIPFPSRFKADKTGTVFYYEYYFTKIELGADLPDSTFILSEEELSQIPSRGTKPVGQ